MTDETAHDAPHFMPDLAGDHCVCRCERCVSAEGCPECFYSAGHLFTLGDGLEPGPPATRHVPHVSACFRPSPWWLRDAGRNARGGTRTTGGGGRDGELSGTGPRS